MYIVKSYINHIIYHIYITFAYTTHAHYILIIASEAKMLHKTKRHILHETRLFFHRQSRECHGGSWESWNVDVESSWLPPFFLGGAGLNQPRDLQSSRMTSPRARLTEVRPSSGESTCAGSGAESLEAVVNVPKKTLFGDVQISKWNGWMMDGNKWMMYVCM